MSRNTTINGFSVPQLGDPANIETAVGTFADAIDTNVIARFANTTARNTAIPSPTAGMVTYRSDQDALEYYSGSAWLLLNGIETGVNQAAVSSGSDTTTSGTFVDLAGTGAVANFSFTKKSISTRLRFELHATFQAVTSSCGAQFAVGVGGTDYTIATVSNAQTVGNHVQVSGVYFASGITTGTYTVQGRWRRFGGTGTCTRDVNDWFSMSCREVL